MSPHRSLSTSGLGEVFKTLPTFSRPLVESTRALQDLQVDDDQNEPQEPFLHAPTPRDWVRDHGFATKVLLKAWHDWPLKHLKDLQILRLCPFNPCT